MKKIILPAIFSIILLVSAYCFADISIEQNCHAIIKSKSVMTPWTETGSDYKRVIFIKDNFLAIQLIVNGIPTKEYGFDFQAKLYYESDLISMDYRKFFFSRINEEYARIKTQSLRSPPGRSMRTAMPDIEGAVNYKVKSGKSLFRKKGIGVLNCALYRFQIGPGYSPFKTFSWGKDVKAWVTKDIPNYSQYESVAAQLKEECAFYLAKSNEVSDFIVTLIYSDGFPIEDYYTIKRDFGVGRLIMNGRSVLSQLDTKPISDNALSFFRDKDAFILNAEEMISSQGQDAGMPFGSQYSMPEGKQLPPQFFIEETLLDRVYTFVIPILFYLGLVYYAYTYATKKTSAPISGKYVLSFYRLIIFLYILQIAHLIIPYYKSIGVEFSIILAIGSAFIIVSNNLETVNNKRQLMNSSYVKVCPHCKAVIEKTYAVCPNCNQKIGTERPKISP